MNLRFDIEDPSNLLKKSWSNTILGGIHEDTEALRDYLLGRVIDRTPYRTGALQEDETGTFNTEPSNPELVHLFTNQASQLEEYDRVYAQFVEGPPVGSTSWKIEKTIGYQHMFDAAVEEDIDYVASWGVAGLDRGIKKLIS